MSTCAFTFEIVLDFIIFVSDLLLYLMDNVDNSFLYKMSLCIYFEKAKEFRDNKLQKECM